ncbi:hypothetical protein [Rufibacter sp. LB8]|uniref:hypothetical protein n=1 Tax=Rufibacter sp. LB8 TaxID=2777781 RepID=UPI00178C7DDC|nr:hypothetical protein [Rufibacter sp. LB8]
MPEPRNQAGWGVDHGTQEPLERGRSILQTYSTADLLWELYRGWASAAPGSAPGAPARMHRFV